jgi:hypothetical protein
MYGVPCSKLVSSSLPTGRDASCKYPQALVYEEALSGSSCTEPVRDKHPTSAWTYLELSAMGPKLPSKQDVPGEVRSGHNASNGVSSLEARCGR